MSIYGLPSVMTINDLPDELFVKEIFDLLINHEMKRFSKKGIIFEHARYEDLFLATQVCKQWEKNSRPIFQLAYREMFSERIPEDGISVRSRYTQACRLFHQLYPVQGNRRDTLELAFAVDRGFEQRARFLIEDKKTNPYQQIECFRGPITIGVGEEMAFWDERQADIHKRTIQSSFFSREFGWSSPMEIAISNANVQMVKILLKSDQEFSLESENPVELVFERIFFRFNSDEFKAINEMFRLLSEKMNPKGITFPSIDSFLQGASNETPQLPAASMYQLKNNLALNCEDKLALTRYYGKMCSDADYDALQELYRKEKKPREDENIDAKESPLKKQKTE